MTSAQVEIRHQASISGVVVNAKTLVPIESALIQIAAAPAEFTSWLALKGLQFGARWDAMMNRPDRTISSNQGIFYFLDLPSGAYTLSASLPSAGTRYGSAQAIFNVSRDAQGNVTLSTSTIPLPVTTLTGTVSSANKPIVMAEVRVQGSSETIRSDQQGKYLFTGLETGNLPVKVLAQGFKPLVQSVNLGPAGTSQNLDFVLTAL